MNARNHLIELECGHKYVTDVAQALIHSLIFFRTYGKFQYHEQGSFSIGSLAYETTNCDLLDFSYIRCLSSSLANRIDASIYELVNKLTSLTRIASLELEFFKRIQNKWPYSETKLPWEMWNINLLLNSDREPIRLATTTGADITVHSEPPGERASAPVEDALCHKMIDIVKIVNSEQYSMPSMPTQRNIDSVFDTSHQEVQPFLYDLTYKLSDSNPSIYGSSNIVGVRDKRSTQSSFRRFLLGTLEL